MDDVIQNFNQIYKLRSACVTYARHQFGEEYVGPFLLDLDKYLHNQIEDRQYADAIGKLIEYIRRHQYSLGIH